MVYLRKEMETREESEARTNAAAAAQRLGPQDRDRMYARRRVFAWCSAASGYLPMPGTGGRPCANAADIISQQSRNSAQWTNWYAAAYMMDHPQYHQTSAAARDARQEDVRPPPRRARALAR